MNGRRDTANAATPASAGRVAAMKLPAGFNQIALSLAFASMPAGTSVLTAPLTASTAGGVAPLREIAGSAPVGRRGPIAHEATEGGADVLSG